jgi:hypothetical protein
MMARIDHKFGITYLNTYFAKLTDLRDKGATAEYIHRITVHIYESLILTSTKTPPYQLLAIVYTINMPWDRSPGTDIYTYTEAWDPPATPKSRDSPLLMVASWCILCFRRNYESFEGAIPSFLTLG